MRKKWKTQGIVNVDKDGIPIIINENRERKEEDEPGVIRNQGEDSISFTEADRRASDSGESLDVTIGPCRFSFTAGGKKMNGGISIYEQHLSHGIMEGFLSPEAPWTV